MKEIIYRKDYVEEHGLTPSVILAMLIALHSNGNPRVPEVPDIRVIRRWGSTMNYGKNSNRPSIKILPPLEILLLIAERLNTNVEFLLSLTNRRSPNSSYIVKCRLYEIRTRKNLSKTDLARLSGVQVLTVTNFEKPQLGVVKYSSLQKFSEALDCSIDYLLGLTGILNWNRDTFELNENTRMGNDIFRDFQGGSPLFIETPSYTSSCILSDDCTKLYFPNGEIKRTESPEFYNATVRSYILKK